MARVSQRLGNRSHPEVIEEKVWAPTRRAVVREICDKAMGKKGWVQIMARNKWFQRQSVRALSALEDDRPRTVFAYSYAAADVLEYARVRGWTTVLGQIDPGPIEAQIVAELYSESGDTSQETIPDAYWQDWRRETELADVIVVNSNWSKNCLEEAGVPIEKIEILPLAYESVERAATRDPLPAVFSMVRPLRLLFLGQVSLRKGIDIVFDAMRQMPNEPIRLDVVGPIQIDVPDWVACDPRIAFHGIVPRTSVSNFYRYADLFLFPTRSDGFGLTQLEALSEGVPVVSSRFCGLVVEDGVNGAVLRELDAKKLAQLLFHLMRSPERLCAWQNAARLDTVFGIDALADRLLKIDSQVLRTV